jgi:hypothetical protein
MDGTIFAFIKTPSQTTVYTVIPASKARKKRGKKEKRQKKREKKTKTCLIEQSLE